MKQSFDDAYAYTLTNECVKNYCNWTLIVLFIVENVVTCLFSERQCTNDCHYLSDCQT